LDFGAELNARIAAIRFVQLPRHPKVTVFAGCLDRQVTVDRLRNTIAFTLAVYVPGINISLD